MSHNKQSDTSDDDMMVDVETLGTEPGSVILSIGATMFDPHGEREVHRDPKNHLYVVINNFDAQNKGYYTHTKTLQWWGKQAIWPSLAQEIFSSKVYVEESCRKLAEFIKEKKPRRVWANSPTFDLSMLRTQFRMSHVTFPVHYRQEKDFRTLMDEAYPDRDTRPARPDYLGEYLPHHALGDAICQAHQLIQAYKTLALLPEHKIGKLPDEVDAQAVIDSMSEDKKNELLRRMLSGDAVRLTRDDIETMVSSMATKPASRTFSPR